jgi:Common central domain of tyrosinase
MPRFTTSTAPAVLALAPVFLLILEQALRSIHPDVSIPYWDWTPASGQSIPAG